MKGYGAWMCGAALAALCVGGVSTADRAAALKRLGVLVTECLAGIQGRVAPCGGEIPACSDVDEMAMEGGSRLGIDDGMPMLVYATVDGVACVRAFDEEAQALRLLDGDLESARGHDAEVGEWVMVKGSVPLAGLTVAAASIAHVSAALALAGGSLAAGELTVAQAVFALLFGNSLGIVTRLFRANAGYYFGLFSKETAKELLFWNFATTSFFALITLAVAALPLIAEAM